MADIATVFHWPLPDLEAMDVVELAEWRERAQVRAERPEQ